MVRLLALLLLIPLLSACASTKFRVLEINSLASEQSGSGQFDGLEALASRAPRTATQRVNIMFLHGIGAIETEEAEPLANNFIQGVANAYGLETEEKTVSSQCGRDEDNEDIALRNHLYITNPATRRFTTVLGSQLGLDRLVCMDRQVLRVRNDLEYVIYRVFWDEIFWESLQLPHLGQDRGSGTMGAPALRRSVNRDLKDELVNYGFSDAVLYLGPAGEDIRRAISGAMCAAALDANGYALVQQGPEVDYQAACARSSSTDFDIDPFAFVAESLGSKIAFDVMRAHMTDGVSDVHDKMIQGTQLYMLANQLPLLGLSDLSDDEPFVRSDYAAEERPTIIAFSEINDFLTYELVPFYEQLSRLSRRVGGSDAPVSRADIAEQLGFDITDMRVEFASPLVPFVSGFVDPLFAHNGHVKQPEVMEFILCGADGRVAKYSGCRIGTPSRARGLGK